MAITIRSLFTFQKKCVSEVVEIFLQVLGIIFLFPGPGLGEPDEEKIKQLQASTEISGMLGTEGTG